MDDFLSHRASALGENDELQYWSRVLGLAEQKHFGLKRIRDIGETTVQMNNHLGLSWIKKKKIKGAYKQRKWRD